MTLGLLIHSVSHRRGDNEGDITMKLSDWTRLLLLAALVGLGTACGEEDTTDPVNNGGSGGDTSGGGEDTNPAVIELMPS